MCHNDLIYDIYWEGPICWQNKKIKNCHVLYQIYGLHHAYGQNSLLYIGKSVVDINKRFSKHDSWIKNEYGPITVHLGSIGLFSGWKKWSQSGDYDKASNDIILKMEKLLIYALQPCYNKLKGSIEDCSGIRIFNTGSIGQLSPEISYSYMSRFFQKTNRKKGRAKRGV